MNTSLEQNTLLEQAPVIILDNPAERTINETITTSTKANLIPMYIILSIYLLIPILSVEGLVGWSIGLIGAYKTVNIYRSDEQGGNKKALKLLVLNISIALIYNTLVYYVTKIIVSKVV